MIMMMLTNFRGRDRETLDQFRLPLPSTRHSAAKVEDLRWIYSKPLILKENITLCKAAVGLRLASMQRITRGAH